MTSPFIPGVGPIRRSCCLFNGNLPQAALIRLEDNFRSTGHILSAANAVIAVDAKRLGKTLRTSKPLGDKVEVAGFRDAEAEEQGVVAEISRRHAEGVGWQDMAILYRSNAMSRSFEEALLRSTISYVLIGGVGFYQRSEC